MIWFLLFVVIWLAIGLYVFDRELAPGTIVYGAEIGFAIFTVIFWPIFLLFIVSDWLDSFQFEKKVIYRKGTK